MSLPALYARWLEELLGVPAPSEPKSTCDDCVMCKSDLRPEIAFNPDTRCCTYVPRMPNFLVGRLLQDDNPALADGQRTTRVRLAQGEGVLPIGVELTEGEGEAYDRLLKAESFGRDDEVACPHQLDGGLCGIWLHRNGVCATWFCRHDRGVLGDAFWNAVEKWLTAIEHRLGLWVAEAVLWDAGLPVDPQNILEGDWARWPGTPEAFYRACADRAQGLSWRAVRCIGGRLVKKRAKAVRKAWAAVNDYVLPDELWHEGYDELDGDEYGRRLMGYSGTDYIEVPGVLPRLLDLFDGRRTSVVLAELRAEGIELKASMLQGLYEHQILVAGDAE
jgi:hypothetical protein